MVVRRRVVRLLAAIGAGVVIASLAPAVAAEAKSPLYGAPKAGQCYNVAGKVAWTKNATSAKPISCSKKHTLWIVKVVKIPAKYKWGTHGYVEYSRAPCRGAIKKALGEYGTKYGMSAYTSFWLGPTKAQRAKGARWIGCELGIQAGKAKLVATKQKRPSKVTGKRLPLRLRLCAVQAADGYYYGTNCAATHDMVALKDEVFSGASDSNIDAEQQRFCDTLGRPWLPWVLWIAPSKAIITCAY